MSTKRDGGQKAVTTVPFQHCAGAFQGRLHYTYRPMLYSHEMHVLREQRHALGEPDVHKHAAGAVEEPAQLPNGIAMGNLESLTLGMRHPLTIVCFSAWNARCAGGRSQFWWRLGSYGSYEETLIRPTRWPICGIAGNEPGEWNVWVQRLSISRTIIRGGKGERTPQPVRYQNSHWTLAPLRWLVRWERYSESAGNVHAARLTYQWMGDTIARADGRDGVGEPMLGIPGTKHTG
ncbi:hypothetical protein C8J57DRAFT_1213362 [Mycena rebaudengoi]|nr:hypothetical protein C8J57DRAFT_1213362 [Mycena rebaudengoi]